MAYLFNLARMTSLTTGTGSITLDAAVSGCLDFDDAGVQDGDTVHYGISDGSNSEVGIGTYTTATKVLTRTTVRSSTNSGSKIDLSGSEQVFICPHAEDLNPLETIIGGVRYKQLNIRNWQPMLTNGCGARAQLEMSTNKNVIDYVPFDAAGEEYAYARVNMPDDYTGGAMFARFYWTHPATTTNFSVLWGIKAVAVLNDGALDVAPGTAVMQSDTGGTTSDLYVSDLTSAFTPAGLGNGVGECEMEFRAGRNVGVFQTPTLAVDAYLLSVKIWYPVDTGTRISGELIG